jgi:hypothetical protein
LTVSLGEAGTVVLECEVQDPGSVTSGCPGDTTTRSAGVSWRVDLVQRIQGQVLEMVIRARKPGARLTGSCV